MKTLFFLTSLLLLEGCGKKEEVYSNEMSTIKPFILSQMKQSLSDSSNFHKTMDDLRLFIQKNTTHTSPPSIYDTHDLDSMLRDMKSSIENNSSKIDIKCGHRAKILEFLAQSLGYKTHWLNIFTDYGDSNLFGHVFLEVQNPETGLYEIVDTDLNIYYSNGEKRLSILDTLTLSYDSFYPCNESGCGWNLEGTQTLKDWDFFKASVVITENLEQIMYLNIRFDKNKVFSDFNKTAIDYFKPYYRIIEL